MKKKVLIIVAVALFAIQFIRPEKNVGEADTSTDITHYVKVPDSVMNILKVSCYDCHSNHTNYRWYNEVMPFGWWLNHHIEDGKRHLNFSNFAKYNKKRIDHKLEETAEEVREHEMPLSTYTLMHRDAALSEAQIKLIEEWVKRERVSLKDSI